MSKMEEYMLVWLLLIATVSFIVTLLVSSVWFFRQWETFSSVGQLSGIVIHIFIGGSVVAGIIGAIVDKRDAQN